MAFQSFDIERTCWRLLQKRVVLTLCNIYIFIKYLTTKVWWGYYHKPHNTYTSYPLTDIFQLYTGYVNYKHHLTLFTFTRGEAAPASSVCWY